MFNEKDDIYLFENDLVEYQKSDEGKRVGRLISYNDYDELTRKSGVSSDEFRIAMEAYWDARNGTGLTFSDKQAQEYGKSADDLHAKLYAEQN